MRHTFSIGDRSGLQAGQSSTRTSSSAARTCNVCRMWFCIVLLKYAWTSLEKMSSWRQHIVLQNLYVLFSINGAITEVQVTFAKGTDTTPYHDRPWLLDLLLVTVWMILFFFCPEHTVSIPPKKHLNTDSSDHSTCFHCVMVHPRCLRAQRSRRRFWTLLT